MASSLRRSAPLVLPAVSRHTATVIFFHGLGDTGNGWKDAIDMIRKRQRLDEVKFILPHAPHIPITVNGGMRMPGWFDIKALGASVEEAKLRASDEDAAGIMVSQKYIHSLVQQEIEGGIPSERIVLGGFSQGGAMSIFSGLTATFKLAGIIGLSSWLLLGQDIQSHIPTPEHNRETPILMGHGSADPVVRYEWADMSAKALKAMNYNLTFKTYLAMAHEAWPQELEEVAAFLASRLPGKGGN